jgi:hypothetical protein
MNMQTQFEMESVFTFTVMSLIYILLLLIWSLALAWPVQMLWNWFVPGIFGLGKITFFQAFGLKSLFGLMFGSVSFNNKQKG